MIDQDEIRKQVAVKNHVWLNENDPILQSVSIFETALEQCVASLHEQNMTQQEANLKVLINHAQQTIEKNRTASMEAAKKGVLSATNELSGSITRSMDEGREQIRKELQYAWGKIEESRKAASMASFIAAGCAAIAITCMVIVLSVVST